MTFICPIRLGNDLFHSSDKGVNGRVRLLEPVESGAQDVGTANAYQDLSDHGKHRLSKPVGRGYIFDLETESLVRYKIEYPTASE